MDAGVYGVGARRPVTWVSPYEQGCLAGELQILGGAIVMASKTLSVYDARLGSEPRRMAVLELRMTGGPQPSAMALPPSSIASWDKDSRLRHLETNLLGAENYQVALVPPEESASRFSGGTTPHLQSCFFPLPGKS